MRARADTMLGLRGFTFFALLRAGCTKFRQPLSHMPDDFGKTMVLIGLGHEGNIFRKGSGCRVVSDISTCETDLAA
jgi:hypothetical protein